MLNPFKKRKKDETKTQLSLCPIHKALNMSISFPFLESPMEVSRANYSILSIRKLRPKEIKSMNMPGTLLEAKRHG